MKKALIILSALCLMMTVVMGAVAVSAASTTKYGDVNGDGSINNRDLGLLQQYINEWEVDIDLEAADVTHDGNINNRDLGLLQQYINEWDVTLDPEVPGGDDEDDTIFNDTDLKWD